MFDWSVHSQPNIDIQHVMLATQCQFCKLRNAVQNVQAWLRASRIPQRLFLYLFVTVPRTPPGQRGIGGFSLYPKKILPVSLTVSVSACDADTQHHYINITLAVHT